MTTGSYAQNRLSTPLEILTFMEASGTDYQIEQLYGSLPRHPEPVLPHGAFALIDSATGREYLREYKDLWSERARSRFERARAAINTEKPPYAKIRRDYQAVLKEFPDHAQIYTLIGETYLDQKQYDAARPWLERAIERNPIDYLARWYWAEIYAAREQWDSAAAAITVAHIYNRNNPRLLLRLQEIYAKTHRTYFRHWNFDPQYRLYKDQKTVVVVADGIWLTYALYKAVWEYEPDYKYIKERQAVTDYLFHQEMEAVVGTFMTFSALRREDQRVFPAMLALELALDNEMLEEYVFYEILLRDQPIMAYHLTPEFLQALVDYVLLVRGSNVYE